VTVRHGLPRSCIVELCGLPGAGKTSLASALGREEGSLITSMPTLGIGPEVPAALRLSRKLGLVAAASIRRPALEATMAHRIWRSGQPGPGDTASRWVQWACAQALMSRARQTPGVHLFDEGVIQALWSLGLRGDPSDALQTLTRTAGRWSRPDLVVVVDPAIDLLVRRLRDRPSRHSRVQRIDDDDQLLAELVHGGSLLDRLLAWWEEVAEGEASVVRIGDQHEDPVSAVDAAIRRITADPSSRGKGLSRGRS
jgi:hypothetical protein